MGGSLLVSPTPMVVRSGKGSRMSLPNSLSLSSPAAALHLACVVSLSSVGRALSILHASFPDPADVIPSFPLYIFGFVDLSESHESSSRWLSAIYSSRCPRLPILFFLPLPSGAQVAPCRPCGRKWTARFRVWCGGLHLGVCGRTM